jgi:hypothetical protein
MYKMILGDENEKVDMMKVIDFLDNITVAGGSIVLYHHPGKDIKRRGRGSNVWEGWVDSLIQMTRVGTSDPLRAKLIPIFLRHAAPGEPLEVELGKNFEFELKSEFELTVKQTVQSYILKAGRDVTTKELFDLKLCKSGTPIYNALSELVADKIVKKSGHGLYKGV